MNSNRNFLVGGIALVSFALIVPLGITAFGSRDAALNGESGTRNDPATPQISKGTSLGEEVYDTYCANCHGVDGKGDGPDARLMKIKPRDFTTGVYEFKYTPVGTLPTDNDLLRTLKLGLRTTAMLPQLQLNRREMIAVVQYIKSFSLRFKEEKPGKVIEIPPAPAKTEAVIEAGRKEFVQVCATCHGTDAEGDGPSAKTLVDYKSRPIRPENLTLRPLKRANSPREIYRTIAAGLDGTPMPSFLTALKRRQIWSIAYYLDTIVKGRLAAENGGGMMGGGMMGGGMMGGSMMGLNFVGEEAIGARIDMAAAHAWMMSGSR